MDWRRQNPAVPEGPPRSFRPGEARLGQWMPDQEQTRRPTGATARPSHAFRAVLAARPPPFSPATSPSCASCLQRSGRLCGRRRPEALLSWLLPTLPSTCLFFPLQHCTHYDLHAHAKGSVHLSPLAPKPAVLLEPLGLRPPRSTGLTAVFSGSARNTPSIRENNLFSGVASSGGPTST